MDILVFIICIALGIGTGALINRRGVAKGRGQIARLSGAIIAGVVVWFITLTAAISVIDPDTTLEGNPMPSHRVADSGNKAPSSSREISTADASTSEKQSPSDGKTADRPHLPISIGDIPKRVNQNLEQLGQPDAQFETTSAQNKMGHDMLSGHINKNAELLATRMHNGDKALDILLMLGGDGGPESALNAALAVSAVLAVMPGMKIADTQDVLNDLLTHSTLQKSRKIERNGIQYSMSKSKVTGVMITITPAS